MTAPVAQAPTGIAMPAPLNRERIGVSWCIAVLVPSEYALENLPIPTDARIRLRGVLGAPDSSIAAITYSRTWQDKGAQLYAGIAAQRLRPIDAPVFARYNPPFTLWFLRRNEVLVPVNCQTL